ncbi:anti-sigma factor family protein [Granulicella mallensis]|uniref:Zinc-finger domain-containing protein n=1 Tax=Granulicella mallensis (strain ATCC BAA-1857 / DSM 23137 / MP5ACTX8) TaxID=682795 RepID=G8P0F6_GRAMM|nr:hypothetical protein [Granulicella mallensis]AEU38044.1 hypothetical protein AciX8_3760 [Granulicella mallensis MP5ACTX8]
MIDCGDLGITIHLLLDNELVGGELEQARVHLGACKSCRVRLQEEEALSKQLRHAFVPLVAPKPLRDRILSLTQASTVGGVPTGGDLPREHPSQHASHRHRPIGLSSGRIALATATLTMVVGGLLVVTKACRDSSTDL